MNNNINKPNNFDIKNYISKSYLHFDFPLTTAEATNFLSSISTDVLCKHRYLPFITAPMSINGTSFSKHLF
ncbi:hypothetical protein LPPLD21_03342 [Lactiplantibacillus paraplantarum]|uniref:Uncharacterized protein n=1 Tax=Lactiplantibacillus paraplantarum TaxID=60520 RepID=A0ABQ0NFH4_9LACO|nr:hypothetical protein LPPLD21_03342 [Lactiplantibacillus paraplantarum]